MGAAHVPRINSKSFCLRKCGTPESYDRYEELVRDWLLKDGDGTKITITVA